MQIASAVGMAFSFALAIQQPAMEIFWPSDEANVKAAQQALFHHAGCSNELARRSEYTAVMEKEEP